jgi:hypothetical protein
MHVTSLLSNCSKKAVLVLVHIQDYQRR